MENEVKEVVEEVSEIFDFGKAGVTLENIKEFELQLKAYKDTLKKSAKTLNMEKDSKIVDEVNELIADGVISKGTKVIFSYKGKNIIGVVATEPKKSSKTLNIKSDELENKLKKGYIEKKRFISVQD